MVAMESQSPLGTREGKVKYIKIIQELQESDFWVAKITGGSHQRQAQESDFNDHFWQSQIYISRRPPPTSEQSLPL
jgi:hypothetical protein